MESNKLITVQFATIHRSQGENETSIVVNVNTRQAIPHVHYVGLYRVTTMDGLYVTDFCESKIAVSPKVQATQAFYNSYLLNRSNCF